MRVNANPKTLNKIKKQNQKPNQNHKTKKTNVKQKKRQNDILRGLKPGVSLARMILITHDIK